MELALSPSKQATRAGVTAPGDGWSCPCAQSLGEGGCHDPREKVRAAAQLREGSSEAPRHGRRRSPPVLQPRPGHPRPAVSSLPGLKAEATPGCG